MDIVIYIAFKEILFFNKNISFIKENINPDNIYIITDSRNFKFIKKDNKITLINENKLVENLNLYILSQLIDNHLINKRYGWYYQQMLKLGFALSKYAKEEYLVWDADTVPFNKLEFKRNGKALILPKKEYHKPYFDTINNLFYAPLKANYSFISEHMLFNVAIVKEMLNLIEKNTGKIWYRACIEAINKDAKNGFSEFETYGTYCLNYHPEIFDTRHLNTFRYCGKIYGIFASVNNIRNLSKELDTGSFEVYDFPRSFILRTPQWLYYKFCLLLLKIRNKYQNSL